MRTLAIVLIVVGILMLIIPGVGFTKKEKVLDIGPVEINKNEKKMLTWPYYVGGIVALSGVVLLISTKKK